MFWAVSFGTVVAVWTGIALVVVATAAAVEDAGAAVAVVVLWAVLPATVGLALVVWKAAGAAGRWVWRRRRSRKWEEWVRSRGGY